jgi:hypothetical protein
MPQLNSPVRPARAGSASLTFNPHTVDQFADIRYQLDIEQSLLRFQTQWVRANPHLYAWSPCERAAQPDPTTVGPGTHNIELDDPWYQHNGTDTRTLTGRDLRYWLTNHLAHHGQTDHRVADLITAVGNAGFTIRGRASKTISDALHTDTDRGRIQRTGWGRYQIAGSLPTTTSWRIRRRCEQLRRDLERCVVRARERLTVIWQHTLGKQHLVFAEHRSARSGNVQLKVINRKVANPTENPKSHTPHTRRSTPGGPHLGPTVPV